MEQVDVTWIRVVKIYWLIFWRGMLLVILSTLLAGFVLPILLIPFHIPETVYIWIARVIGAAIGAVVGIFVIKMLFEKSFSDFELVLVKPGSQAVPSDSDESNPPDR